MPVVINEIHVKVSVDEAKKVRPQQGSSTPDRFDRDALVNTCVEKVLEIIKMENRR